jgi:hypothetical protein
MRQYAPVVRTSVKQAAAPYRNVLQGRVGRVRMEVGERHPLVWREGCAAESERRPDPKRRKEDTLRASVKSF